MGIDYVGVEKLLESISPSGTRQKLRNFRNTDFFFKLDQITKTVHILDACGGSDCASVTNSIEDVQDQICEDNQLTLSDWRWIFYSPDGFVTEFLRDGALVGDDGDRLLFRSFDRGRIKDATFTVDLEYYKLIHEIKKLTTY